MFRALTLSNLLRRVTKVAYFLYFHTNEITRCGYIELKDQALARQVTSLGMRVLHTSYFLPLGKEYTLLHERLEFSFTTEEK